MRKTNHKYHIANAALLVAALWTVASASQAQPATQVPHLFRDADMGLGQRLIAEHKCSACHQQKVGGDGSAIYRPAGRINSPSALNSMVEQCNTTLSLGLFPEEVTAIAAVLNKDHYRFTPSGSAPK